MQAKYVSGAREPINYTAGGNISAGDVIITGYTIGVATHDAVSGDLIALDTSGVFEFVKIDSYSLSAGEEIYWDPTGNPKVGTAGTGAASNSGSFMGMAAEPCESGAATVKVLLNQALFVLD